MPAPIRPLPPELVNQIAAGEVVERPASVLKELVENSLDAGARRIEIAIEEGGRRLLRVVDDGAGIAAEQLPLAVASHATSKLHALEQLFSIRSLGFRGEALASIGSVSELRLASRPPGQPCGAEIRVRGGLAGEVRPSAVAVGTLVEVRNLFFNTPARRKFLGSPAAESRACARTLMRLALASPEVGMRLRSGGRTLIEAPPSEGEHALRERVTALFGRAVTDDLVPVAFERDGLVVRGLAALPRRNRGDSTHQFVALKVRGGRARPIRDKLIAAAIREAYRGLLMTRRHAVVFLELELGAEDVDVNVHPAKLEVRFRHGSNVFGTVVRALRAALDGALAPAVLETSESPPAPPPAATPASSSDGPRWAWRPRPITRRPPAAPVSEGASETASAASATSTATSARSQTAETLASSPAGASQSAPAPSPAPAPAPTAASREPAPAPAASALPGLATRRTVGALQLRSGYLVVEAPDGFEVIDPHALHERILYEELRERVRTGALEVQPLLVPVVLDLAADERAIVPEALEPLARLGLVLEPFGNDTWALQAYPTLLHGPGGGKPRLDTIVRDVLEVVASGASLEREALFERVLATLACKAAVKLGERLRLAEIEALLARRERAERSTLCPHGRPSSLHFHERDLERQFRR